MELSAAAMACEVVSNPKPQWAQTYILKGHPKAVEGFREHSCREAHRCVMRHHIAEGEVFLVITYADGSNTISKTRQIRERLQKIQDDDLLIWVRPFSERFASLFGWDFWTRERRRKALGLKKPEEPQEELAVLQEALEMQPGLEKLEELPNGVIQYSWVHPRYPLPLFVLCPKKPSDEEKLSWILQEVPGDADIHTFAKKFVELFGLAFSTKTARQTSARRIWGLHVGQTLEKGVDLDAEDLELFELAFDAKARARCRLCKGEVAEVQAAYFHTKAPRCQQADCTVPQARCRACEAESEATAGWHTCKPCKREPLPTPTGTDCALLRSLKRSHEMLRIHNNVWQTDIGEAAVKKRKRT